ncbi:MAG TPA: hypothetical protein VGK87_04040 [Anaerolineae bacterium]
MYKVVVTIATSIFERDYLNSLLERQLSIVNDKVKDLRSDLFAATSDADLLQHFLGKLSIDPIVLHDDLQYQRLSMEETSVNAEGWRGITTVDGSRFSVRIPYSGEYALWWKQPNDFQSPSPHFSYRVSETESNDTGYLELVIEQPVGTSFDEINQKLSEAIGLIKYNLESQRLMIEQFHAELPGLISKAIQKRRQNLRYQESVAKRLNIPLERKSDVPPLQPIPIKTRIVPQLTSNRGNAEREITDEGYEDILSIIRHEGRTFEVDPAIYAIHEEEDLRSMIVAHLNGYFKGQATGETFRKNGKTDIIIEAEDRAAFVAECKIWKGAQVLHDAIDQLLGYLTWRDCKASIVIFNTHIAGFTEILGKVAEVMKSHPKFLREAHVSGKGEWRFIFTAKEDDRHLITIHVFMFNIYYRGARIS